MLQPDGPAPYASISAVAQVIERHRQIKQKVIDIPTLERMGIGTLSSRTVRSLELLDLISSDGQPTDAFETIRIAPSDAWKAALAEHIRAVYSPVFSVMDPTTASAQQIADAFLRYEPSGMRNRMISLFVGLMEYAEMVDEAPRRKRGPKPGAGPRPRTNGVPKSDPASRGDSSNGSTDSVSTVAASPNEPIQSPPGAETAKGDTYEVALASGGIVAVTVDVNLFRMSVEDRNFVMDLVDKIVAYRTAEEELVSTKDH